MSKSRFISAPESMKVHSFDPGAWSRHMITRARQEESVGLFKVVHGDLFGDVFVIGPELIIKIEIFDRRPSSQAVKNLSSKNKTLCTVISNADFSALLPFSFFLQDFFYALIPLVKLLPFLPSKQEKKESSEGHTVRI